MNSYCRSGWLIIAKSAHPLETQKCVNARLNKIVVELNTTGIHKVKYVFKNSIIWFNKNILKCSY